MTRNHTLARFPLVFWKNGDTVSVPCASSGPYNTMRPSDPPVLTDRRVGLLTAIKGTLETVILQMTCSGHLAAVRLLPPDFPILAVLAGLSGWGVL